MKRQESRLKYLRVLLAVFACVCLCFLQGAVTVHAESNLNLTQVKKVFSAAIAKEQASASFQTSSGYTIDAIQEQLEKAALENNKICVAKIYYEYRRIGNGSVDYTFFLPEGTFEPVKILKSKAAARKAALLALRDGDYDVRYYSKTNYYSEFMKMLQQHPEYNYNTVVWHSSNGSYGFRMSSELTEYEQSVMMKAAEEKAEKIAEKYVDGKSSVKQKYKAIHDYLIQYCDYNYSATKVTSGFHSAFTPYGALVKKSAVCQGYAGAFNLIAQKAGLLSIAACGTADGVSHAWNYVKVGDKYRYIDCTWDDTVTPGRISYLYFLTTKGKLSETHSWTATDFSAGYLKYCKYLL